MHEINHNYINRLKVSARRYGSCTWCMSIIFMALYAFKMSLKNIFNLVSAAGDMLVGAQNQIVVAGHVKYIKLTTIA